jgi:Holliday junction resolvase RusA-like endonuclease
VALLELCKKGAVPFTEKVVIIYNYHFPKEIMDVDNYAIKTINDTFRDARIIKDDSVNYLSVHIQGEVNKGKKGLEIMVLREKDFYRLYIEEDSTV